MACLIAPRAPPLDSHFGSLVFDKILKFVGCCASLRILKEKLKKLKNSNHLVGCPRALAAASLAAPCSMLNTEEVEDSRRLLSRSIKLSLLPASIIRKL